MANELKKEKTPNTESTVEEMKPRPKHLFMGKFYFGLGEIYIWLGTVSWRTGNQ